jgi:hypothetical protein
MISTRGHGFGFVGNRCAKNAVHRERRGMKVERYIAVVIRVVLARRDLLGSLDVEKGVGQSRQISRTVTQI